MDNRCGPLVRNGKRRSTGDAASRAEPRGWGARVGALSPDPRFRKPVAASVAQGLAGAGRPWRPRSPGRRGTWTPVADLPCTYLAATASSLE
jgi:hypothetical protein